MLWYLINPLVLMGAYALVFSVLLKVADIPDYPLFLLVGLIVWVFFAQALLAAAPSLVQNAPLVRKVRFPRETIPASVATVQLVTFLVMLGLVAPVALACAARSTRRCCCCRSIVVLLFAFVLGLSLAWRCCTPTTATSSRCSAAALLPWFFLTPIFLPVDDMPGVADHASGSATCSSGATRSRRSSSAVRDVLYAGAAPSRRPPALPRWRPALGALGARAGCVFRRMERDLAVVL